MKKILLLLPYLLLLIDSKSYAQQDPQFSQYQFNKLVFNPAYAGMRKALCFNGLFREQWNGFPGNPRNYLFSGDIFLRNAGGAGLTLISDQLGFDKTNIAKLAYSFHLPNIGVGTLSFGAEVGMVQKTLGNAWVYNDQGDPFIPMNGASTTIWDLGLGVYYETESGLFFGLSTLHIPRNTFTDNNLSFFASQIHYYLTAGCDFNLPEYDIVIKPSLLAKTDAATTQIDFNTIALWRRSIWIGGSYRLTDAFIVMAGIQRGVGENNIMKLGYSYDITTSALKNHSTGSHEIFVSYCHPITEKPRKTIWNNVREMWSDN